MKLTIDQNRSQAESSWDKLPNNTKPFTVLDALDEITDEQMNALAIAANPLRTDSFKWVDLGELYLNLERIRKAIKGRLK